MKDIFTKIALIILITMPSCKDMKLDIQDSKDRLDVLEGTTITTINEQITAINSSITDLESMDETLDGYIKSLETTAENLQKQINDANAEIAKVESELGDDITALEQSLLYELNAAKSAIEAEMSAINLTLVELKVADAALDKKIADLRTYVDTELASTKEWANATFSTLTQYEQTQTEISGIKASIEQMNADMAALETRLNGKIAADIKTAIDALRIELNADHASRIESAVNNLTVAYTAAVSSARSEITTAYTNAISNAIIESESGMKAWVNTKLTQGYYDIATIDGKLQALSGRLDEADEELQKQIDQQKSDLETAKSELTSAYKKAINDAIQTNNGVISAEIAEAVQKLETKTNSRLSTIESQIIAMQKGIDEIIDDIDTIQKQIESINTTLGTLEVEDQELNSMIDKLQSDYAALLQELEEIRPIDEISKKTIVDDISTIKALIDLIEERLGKLETDFINRIQSLKYIPEYSDGTVMVSDIYRMKLTVDFLVSPAIQAEAVLDAWQANKNIVKSYLRYTKPAETKSISPAIPLEVMAVNVNENGVLTVSLAESEDNPVDADDWYKEFEGVVYLQITDGNTDVVSDFIKIHTYYDDLSKIEDTANDEFDDLSPLIEGKYRTANSYIVSQAGVYTFKAYKGNSQELAGSLTNDNHPMGLIDKVEVLWETFGTKIIPEIGSLVQTVVYNGESIYFRTPFEFSEGNAVIAAKDASGNILWSWHIWLTDQPQGQEYYNNAGIMMDRNLGATSATPGDVGALGLLYQWGRKDPFLGASSIGGDTVAKSTISWPSSVSTSSSCGTVSYVVANPTTVVTASSSPYDWHYSSRDNTLWTTSDKTKSIYDPCPAGWRVPDGGGDGVWSKALGSSSYFTQSSLYNSSNKGMNFSGKFGSASIIWYPASGYRDCRGVGLYSVGDGGSYWSASPNSNSVYHLTFDKNGYVYPSNYNDRAYGRSVRCLQE